MIEIVDLSENLNIITHMSASERVQMNKTLLRVL